jgi:hypothetical protein
MGVIDDSFLEEQIERMRRLTERMSQVHSRVVEHSASVFRDRDQLHSPLSDVSDLRTHQSHSYPLSKPRRRRR